MQCVSIHRLEKTWSSISKKDKQTFDRLSDIFNEKNNRENLREYLESLKLPCIPFLGEFLLFLVVIFNLVFNYLTYMSSEQCNFN